MLRFIPVLWLAGRVQVSWPGTDFLDLALANDKRVPGNLRMG
jgi:hypothetical protein